MAEPSQLAICCGPIVTTWDYHSGKQQANSPSFSPHKEGASVVDISWNTSGQVLASCLQVNNGEDNVVLTSQINHTRLDSFRHDAGLKRPASNAPKPPNTTANPTCIEFGAKSRYLLVGDDSGAVVLWDLKKKTRVRHYFHAQASLEARLDPTDSNILSLSSSSLNIFRLREATLAATIAESCRFCKFSTSNLEPRHVVIGTRIGSLHLYDVTRQQSKMMGISPHTGYITGVEYSKVNSVLVASSSVDETLCFSDTSTGKVVQRMTLESSATSLSFHTDGRTCAVGCKSGRVLVYDLRNPSDAVASCEMKNAVSCIEFAPGTDGKSTAAVSKPRRSTLSSTDSTANDEIGRVVDSVLTDRLRDSLSKENKKQSDVTTFKRSPSLMDKDAIREIVREELDVVRDEMDEAMRNLQVEMCRQFLKQSQEHSLLVSRLEAENDELREENEFLRQTSGRR